MGVGLRFGRMLGRLVPLAVLAFAVDFLSQSGISWVGFGDLEITFLVTDAETNEPIAGAEIDAAVKAALNATNRFVELSMR